MNYSENYGFALPNDEDFYDIAPISENFDSIDTILAEGEGKMAEISDKIGTPAESGNTVFSLLENSGGGSVIRSIQRKTLSFTHATKTTDFPITTVDTAKTIVLMERIFEESSNGAGKIDYTLTADNLHVETGSFTGTVGFWIIEFA